MNSIFMKLLILLSFAAQCAVAPAASDEEMARLNERRSALHSQKRLVEDWAQHLDELEARLRQRWDDFDTTREELESLVNETLDDIDEEIREVECAIIRLRISERTEDDGKSPPPIGSNGNANNSGGMSSGPSPKRPSQRRLGVKSKASSVASTSESAAKKSVSLKLCKRSKESDHELNSDGGIGARSQLDDEEISLKSSMQMEQQAPAMSQMRSGDEHLLPSIESSEKAKEPTPSAPTLRIADDEESRARMQLDDGAEKRVYAEKREIDSAPMEKEFDRKQIESSQMGVIDTSRSNPRKDDQESPSPLCEGSNKSDQELSGDEEIGARSQLDDDKNSNKQRGSEHGAKVKQSARNKRKKRSKKPKPKATPSHVVKKEDIIKLYTCDDAVMKSLEQKLITNMQNDLIIIDDLANGKGDKRTIYTNDEVGILSPSIYVPLISHIEGAVHKDIVEDVINCYIQTMSRLDAGHANVFEAVKQPNRMGDRPAWFTMHHEFMSRVQEAYDKSEVRFEIPLHQDQDVVPISFAFLRNTFEEIVQAKIDQLTQLIDATHFREKAIEELQHAKKETISTATEFFEHCKKQDLVDDVMYVVFADFKDKLDDFNILVANLNVVIRICNWRKDHHGVIAVLSPLCCEHLDINNYLTSMGYESSAIQRFTIGSGLELQPFPLEDKSTDPCVRIVWYDKRARFTSGKQLVEAQNEKNNIVIIMESREVEEMQEKGRYSSYTEMDLLLKHIYTFIDSMNFGELQKADKEHCRLLLSRILWTFAGCDACEGEFVDDILRKMAVTMSGKKEFVDFERLVKMGFKLMKMMVSQQKEFVVLTAMQTDGINDEMLEIIFAFIEACIKKSFEIQLGELNEGLKKSDFAREYGDLMRPYFEQYEQIMERDSVYAKIQRLFEKLRDCRADAVESSEELQMKQTLQGFVSELLDMSQPKSVLKIAHILYEHKERSGELRVFIAFNSEWDRDLIEGSLIECIDSMGYKRRQINSDKKDVL